MLFHVGNRFHLNVSMYTDITFQKIVSFIFTVVRNLDIVLHTNL